MFLILQSGVLCGRKICSRVVCMLECMYTKEGLWHL